jgi:uncharacterized membrane protein YjjP (DUF1212 family)
MEDTSLLIEVINLCGKIILENGGEIYRAEDTITRICSSCGCHEVETFALPTGFFVGFKTRDLPYCTTVKRIKMRGTNLEKLNQVNHIARCITSGSITLHEARISLIELSALKGRNKYLVMAAAGLSTSFFTFLFGGTILDFFVALISGFLIQFFASVLTKSDLFHIMMALLGGAIASLLAVGAATFLPISPQIVIVSAMMPLFPGISMTNAVRDTMRGDLSSGLAKGTEAILIAVMLSVGTGITFSLFKGTSDMTIAFSSNFWQLIWSSFGGTFFFAFIQESPRKSILLSALMGALSCIAYYLCMLLTSSTLASLFLGALVIALISEILSRWLKMPTTTFISTAIVPLVPGIALFLTMFAMVEQDYLKFLSRGIMAALQIGAMAMGLAVDSFIMNILYTVKQKIAFRKGNLYGQS